MYIPAHFRCTDLDVLATVIDDNSFGTLVTMDEGRPFATHVPFVYERAEGLLHCHVARANPQWQHAASGNDVMAIFTGPHGYISPTWYVSAGVPTWNYVAVHVYGSARTIDDAAALGRHVETLAARHERGESPWVPNYDPRRLQGIVGIEIRIKEIEGKLKLSQNRSSEDRARVAAALDASERHGDRDLARLIPLD